MKTFKKIPISFFLILSILGSSLFLIIYPNLNSIKNRVNQYDSYDISKEIAIRVLSMISPQRERYSTEVLGYTTIEESLREKRVVLDRKVLEEQNTVLNIERIGIEGHILQGVNSLRMDDGFWHFPITPFPGDKGNSVIIGHRFMHMPPNRNTLFNLDQIRVGEEIIVKGDLGTYRYIVVDIKEVEPNDVSVIQDSNDYTLTLITCTPLWTSEKRLVVVAKLDKLYKKV